MNLRRAFRLAKKFAALAVKTAASIDAASFGGASHISGAPPKVQGAASWQDYEAAAAAYLRQLGYHNVIGNQAGSDGGVDVRVPGELVGQVKFEQGKTGRPVIMQIFGVAAQQGVRALCFSHAGYTKQAITWANEAPVALFVLRYERGKNRWEIRTANGSAKDLQRTSGQSN